MRGGGSSRYRGRAFLVLVLLVLGAHATLGNAVNSSAMMREGMKEENSSLVLRSSRGFGCPKNGFYGYGRGRCCRMCPAGTCVAEHCLTNNGRAKCKDCVEGEEYTSWDNGLDACLTCTTCREDQQQVSPCTVKNDTNCQCRAGTFCTPGEICEVCHKCESCPEGQIVKVCTLTSNTVCGKGKTETETNSTLTPFRVPNLVAGILCALVILVVIILVFYRWRKALLTRICGKINGYLNNGGPAGCENVVLQGVSSGMTNENPSVVEGVAFLNSNRQTATDKEQAQTEKDFLLQNIPEDSAEHRAGSFKGTWHDQIDAVPRDLGDDSFVEQSAYLQVTDKHPCPAKESMDGEDLKQSFYFFVKEVPLKKWKELMRKLSLTENEIEVAEQNNSKNINEAHYQMLNTWLQKTGNDASATMLLNMLKEMNLNEAAENIKRKIKFQNADTNLQSRSSSEWSSAHLK